jgi:hypothetical protein
MEAVMWAWYWRFKLRALREEEADFVARLARIRKHIREHESLKK